MERGLFYVTFFDNIFLFLSCMLLMMLVNFWSIHRLSVGGIIDPVHFYWTFTFGTAYGIVFALFLNGDIEFYLFFMVFSYGLIFTIFANLFNKVGVKPFDRLFFTISHARSEPKILLFLIQIIFIIDLFIILYFIGFGFLAEDNRFEQNRGMGFFVRVFAALRLFLVAYYSLLFSDFIKRRGVYRLSFVLYLIYFIAFIVFTSLIDGAKFALLESAIVVVVALVLSGSKLRINFFKLVIIAVLSFVFALIVYSVNLEKNGYSSRESEYIEGAPFVIEAMSLRVLANADKYFLSLPNEVIETLEIKSAWVRLLAPVIGSTRLSNLLGFNVNDYSIGKQILLYWHPDFKISGGPTSHFDLFAYKQFGFIFGYFWVILTAYILVGIKGLARLPLKSKYSVSILVVLWVRSWALVIEPPLGLGYILDVCVIFSLLIIFNGLLKRQGAKNGR